MCGIAGRILKTPGPIGADLIALMDAQSHRGADSTGFAIYGEPRCDGFIVRIMGFSRGSLHRDLDDFLNLTRDHGSDFLEQPTWNESTESHYSARLIVKDMKNLSAWIRDADTLAARLEVQSVGRSLEIIKDTGDAREVAEKHNIETLIGTLAWVTRDLRPSRRYFPMRAILSGPVPSPTLQSCITDKLPTISPGAIVSNVANTGS